MNINEKDPLLAPTLEDSENESDELSALGEAGTQESETSAAPEQGTDEAKDSASSAESALAAMQARLDAQDAMIRSLLQQRQAAPEPAPAVPTMPSFADLPDPVDSPEEFRTALQQRIAAAVEFGSQQAKRSVQDVAEETRTAATLDRVWSQFKTEHPDLAKRELLARAAASVEMDALRNMGVENVAAAIGADPNGFIKRVADRMQKELGSIGTVPRMNRTGGLGPGSRSPLPATGAAKPASFVAQLRKAQLDAGII